MKLKVGGTFNVFKNTKKKLLLIDKTSFQFLLCNSWQHKIARVLVTVQQKQIDLDDFFFGSKYFIYTAAAFIRGLDDLE